MGACSLRVEMKRLRMATLHFRMETPLRGRSGGHTGAPLPFQHTSPFRKDENKNFGTRSNAANGV